MNVLNKRIFLFFLFAIYATVSNGQFKVEINLRVEPKTHLNDTIFITGNFNKWTPNDQKFKLTKIDKQNYHIVLYLNDIPSDRLEYKFLRGTWSTLECNQQGRLEIPRILALQKDTVVNLVLKAWRDDFPPSTASKNVKLWKKNYRIDAFDDHRDIWVYLPDEYETNSKIYPVMYMHDGQQMFDEATSTGRTGPIEWGVDEILDESKTPHIVVAINHNSDKSKRIQEYLIYPNKETQYPKGSDYLTFIINELKPMVDNSFRTIAGPEGTTLIGSSMGGLISLYGGLMYPEVFGNIGVLSPSIWSDDGNIEKYISTHLKLNDHHLKQNYFFYAGGSENRRKSDGNFVQMDSDVNRVIDLINEKGKINHKKIINPNGRHGGIYWREIFPVFFDWLNNINAN